MFQDKTLVCKDCGAEFVFTAGEQEFYAEKGFQNEPIRCKACRNARKSQRSTIVRCMMRSAHSAARPPRSRSFPRTTGPSTAAPASRAAEAKTTLTV